MNEIKAWVKEALNIMIPAQSDNIFENLQIQMNSRFIRKIADARFHGMRIRFSTKYWEVMTPEEKKNTVFHEVAHIVVKFNYYALNQSTEIYDEPSPHGKEWKSLMIKCGENPKRIANLGDRLLLVQRPKIAQCSCNDKIHISKVEYNRIKRGEIYQCTKCRSVLTVA